VVGDCGWEPLGNVLKWLGTEHALVVHAQDGLDEISITSPTNICELNQGEITSYQITPEDFNLNTASMTDIQVENVEQSAAIINEILAGQQGAASDIVCLNAGAAIYVAGKANSLKAGMQLAQQQLMNKSAQQTLAQLVEFTNNI